MDEFADFTVDPVNFANLAGYFDYLDNVGMKSIIIIDPAIPIERQEYWPYEEGQKNDVFIRWPTLSPDFVYTNSTIMVGAVCSEIDSLFLYFDCCAIAAFF